MAVAEVVAVAVRRQVVLVVRVVAQITMLRLVVQLTNPHLLELLKLLQVMVLLEEILVVMLALVGVELGAREEVVQVQVLMFPAV